MANTTIQIKKSATPTNAPATLEFGELAINYADGKIFFKNSTGVIVSSNLLALGVSNSFGTMNANNVLVTADTSGDVFRIDAGSNINIEGDSVNNRIIISATAGASDPGPAFDKANSANIIAVAAFEAANNAGGGGSPSGANLSFQYRNGTNFAGANGFYFDISSNTVVITQNVAISNISANGSVGTEGQILVKSNTSVEWKTMIGLTYAVGIGATFL